MIQARHVACMGEVGEVNGTWPEDRSGRDHLDDNIKMDVKTVGWEGVYIHLSQGDQWQTFVNTVTNLYVPHEVGNLIS
jgi:hypothetical protein